MTRPATVVEETRIGRREHNEDRSGCWQTSSALLMAVADGLGGHNHGEVAAQLAIDVLGASFQAAARPRLEDPAHFLAAAFAAGHAAIVREAGKRGYEENPRTVIAACVTQDGHAYWAHVGDCRFYLVRKGRVVTRSHDHTVVQQLIDQGRIREEAAATHPYRNRLLRCLGGVLPPTLEPPASARLAHEDILLLCSDGFWGPLPQRQILHELLSRPLAEAIAELVAQAETRAGPGCDNITVTATVWEGEPPS